MTKQEFIEWFAKNKEPSMRKLYGIQGEPTLKSPDIACFLASMADVKMNDAPKFWRKHRAELRNYTIEEFARKVAEQKAEARNG